MALAGQEAIDDVHMVAVDMERKWGRGRLRLLVDADLREKFDRHRVIARWTYPIWLYVSVTGVVIYVMLYHLYA